MSTEVSALLWKEMRQLPRKRSAMISAIVFPTLFFLVVPLGNIFALRSGVLKQPVGTNMPAGFGNLPNEGSQVIAVLLLPLFVVLGGLVIPSITATYTIVAERERRSLELLVALPVSLGQIILAKLLSVLILGAAVALPLFAIDAVVMIAFDVVPLADVLGMLFLLLATLIYSTASALFVALIAADFRTANNLNGALLGPTILGSMAALALLPGGTLRLFLLGGGFLVLSTILMVVALRVLTIERFLR